MDGMLASPPPAAAEDEAAVGVAANGAPAP
jgi:hypothetical protein